MIFRHQFAISTVPLKSFESGYVGDAFQHWGEKYVSSQRQGTRTYEGIYDVPSTSLKKAHFSSPNGSLFRLGTGVFNSDGEMWKFHRNMTRLFFNEDRIRDLEIFDSHAIDTTGQMKKRLAEGHPIEFQLASLSIPLPNSCLERTFAPWMRDYLTPKSSGIANPASLTNHPSTVFVNAFMKGQELTTRRNRTGTTWPLAEFWGDKVAEQRQIVDGFVKPILADVLAKKASGEKKASEEEDFFLGHLVNYTEDEQVLLDELVNILVASRDTRLRDEVMKHVGPTSAPPYDIKEMKFLRAFLNETLRLCPPVPFDARTIAGPTAILNPRDSTRPLFVPANTKVLYSIFLFHRRKDLWGPDADEFDPDRFIDRLHKYLAPNPFIFLPFNAGPRICLGQQVNPLVIIVRLRHRVNDKHDSSPQFAYNEASFFLVSCKTFPPSLLHPRLRKKIANRQNIGSMLQGPKAVTRWF
ncbi:cytochrome p450 monooxygenase pc-1 [Moniliophthora roreri MCA 2997]|uniref:Cytochrome p450 monooxygenase pc-1 n=1 Tax=Moniliophthora roreri (strain MCA 2997) TaxID=1381753 RepID=V2WKS2_MONRO|nr:cytochrome p450 monooxygenase pc-1 [Moniliophthora roreri MCA 2997]